MPHYFRDAQDNCEGLRTIAEHIERIGELGSANLADSDSDLAVLSSALDKIDEAAFQEISGVCTRICLRDGTCVLGLGVVPKEIQIASDTDRELIAGARAQIFIIDGILRTRHQPKRPSRQEP